MPEHPTDAHFSFTFVFKQALKISRSRMGEWKLNVTDLGAGAINPRKGDSSCYPR